MTSHSTIVGVTLAVMLMLVTDNVQAQKQPAGERRDAVSPQKLELGEYLKSL